MPKYIWNAPAELPDGHRLFYGATGDDDHDAYNKVAIADDSGGLPQDTDDGVLFLDQSRPLYVGYEDQQQGRCFALIPVVDLDGEGTHALSDAATILRLSREFRWTVSDRNIHYYNVR